MCLWCHFGSSDVDAHSYIPPFKCILLYTVQELGVYILSSCSIILFSILEGTPRTFWEGIYVGIEFF